MSSALEIRELHKHYGDHHVIRGVSFSVRAGEVVGLLGPNGAGKTTTLECAEGLRRPDRGTVTIAGIDPQQGVQALRKVLGVQLQTSALPSSWTPAEALRLFARYHGERARPELLDRLGLSASAATPYASLSVGQQRRLNLALAISHHPKVVVLDEPTAGLDVSSRQELHDIIRELRDEGVAVLLATHDMAEAELLADRVVILLNGRVIQEATPRELTASGSSLTRISLGTQGTELHFADLADLPSVTAGHDEDGCVVLFSEDASATVVKLIDRVREKGGSLNDLRVERPSLEERFLEVTREAS